MQMVPVIKDYPTPPSLHPGTLIAKEVLASLSTAILFPFGLRKPKRKTPRLADQRTIVFVHGYLSNPSCFLPLSLYLRTRGHSACLSYSYSGEQGVEQAAIGLKSFLRRHVRGGEIDLVCHSLGGLVARVYIQELGGSRRVRSVVTLGTPHRGTYNAYWLWSRVGRELRPDSLLLKRLSDSPRSHLKPCHALSIIAGSDNIILPRVFGKGSEEVLYVPQVGHMGLLYSLKVFQGVNGFLRKLNNGQEIEALKTV
ncbi:MAG: hypothetical protein NTV34_07445 [Proteobacteria bacterium]|nr:hypothetical protein [Pseudomonadota bacterium]